MISGGETKITIRNVCDSVPRNLVDQCTEIKNKIATACIMKNPDDGGAACKEDYFSKTQLLPYDSGTKDFYSGGGVSEADISTMNKTMIPAAGCLAQKDGSSWKNGECVAEPKKEEYKGGGFGIGADISHTFYGLDNGCRPNPFNATCVTSPSYVGFGVDLQYLWPTSKHFAIGLGGRGFIDILGPVDGNGTNGTSVNGGISAGLRTQIGVQSLTKGIQFLLGFSYTGEKINMVTNDGPLNKWINGMEATGGIGWAFGHWLISAKYSLDIFFMKNTPYNTQFGESMDVHTDQSVRFGFTYFW